jgi:hypothetical protein
MIEESKEKLVNIQPLEEKPRVTKPAGRKPISQEERNKKRLAKGQNLMKDIVNPTPARKKAMEKARITRDLKREYRRTNDEQRKYDLAIQINSMTPNKVEVPVMNGDLKAKIKLQNPAYGEEGIEPSLLEMNPTTKNVQQPESADKMLQWSNGSQELWSGKLNALETKMNALDNYLSKIRVLNSEGDNSDYANRANVKQNHYIIPHNQKVTPNQPVFGGNPFHSNLMFRNAVLKRKT